MKSEFHDSIPYFVFTAAHAIEKAMGAALEGHGITFRQCQMLGMLAAHGSLSQAEVAEKMGVEPSSVARLVDRMTRDGWIERRPDPHDRRKNRLFATAQAEPVWDQVRSVACPVREKALEGLNDQEVSELKRMLRHLRNNLGDPRQYPDELAPSLSLQANDDDGPPPPVPPTNGSKSESRSANSPSASLSAR